MVHNTYTDNIIMYIQILPHRDVSMQKNKYENNIPICFVFFFDIIY